MWAKIPQLRQWQRACRQTTLSTVLAFGLNRLLVGDRAGNHIEYTFFLNRTKGNMDNNLVVRVQLYTRGFLLGGTKEKPYDDDLVRLKAFKLIPITI